MRKTTRLAAGALSLALALGGCGGARVAVRPNVGDSLKLAQTFRITERTSGGEELPGVRIERSVTLTCTALGDPLGDARSSFDVVTGDVSVWIDDDGGEPDFVASDAGSAEGAFDAADSSLARMYAALWATTAHRTGALVIDGYGNTLGWGGALDDVRTDRGEDPSADLGGSLLESLLDDPSLLFAGTDDDGRRPLRFRLDHWHATFTVVAAVEERDEGAFVLEYESDPAAGRDGPFESLALRIDGDGKRDVRTGFLDAATLSIAVSAVVPTGPGGGTRTDTAKITYALERTGP